MADQPNPFQDPTPNGGVTNQGGDQTTKTPSSDSAYADLLAAIRNEEGKPKYDSVQKALEGLSHAQSYIPQLKTELQTKEEEINNLRAEMEKRGSIEDVISRLTAKQDQGGQHNEGTPPQQVGLDEQAAKALFEQMLNETKQKESFRSNEQTVQNTLYAKYGEKTSEVVANKAKELGTTASQLGELAKQNPQMVLALFNTSASQAGPTTSSRTIPSSYIQKEDPLERPSKSLLAGATGKEQAEFMRKIKERVYARHGIDN